MSVYVLISLLQLIILFSTKWLKRYSCQVQATLGLILTVVSSERFCGSSMTWRRVGLLITVNNMPEVKISKLSYSTASRLNWLLTCIKWTDKFLTNSGQMMNDRYSYLSLPVNVLLSYTVKTWSVVTANACPWNVLFSSPLQEGDLGLMVRKACNSFSIRWSSRREREQESVHELATFIIKPAKQNIWNRMTLI